MRLFTKDSFFWFLLALLFVLLSFMVKSAEEMFNIELRLIAIVFAAIYWIKVMKEIRKSTHIKPVTKKYWQIICISIPFLGGFLFHLFQTKKERILTS